VEAEPGTASRKDKEMNTLIVNTYPLAPALDGAIEAWAEATTDTTSRRRADLLRDKVRAVCGFFDWVRLPVGEVKPKDVIAWRGVLDASGLAPATVYAMISRVSSFYEWAMKEPALKIEHNPANLARPKAPKAYQTVSTQALDDEEIDAILQTVKHEADSDDLVAKRDYAMLLLYCCTGLRRAEVANLYWRDVKINGGLVLTIRCKGGEYISMEVNEPAVKAALLDYLTVSGRLAGMVPDSPLWTRHDKAGEPGGALTSHAFVKNLKRYAKLAGVGAVHLHQTRHTYARIVAEESGSMLETQEALGHKNRATTQIYVQRIGVKRDKFSSRVAQRFNLEGVRR